MWASGTVIRPSRFFCVTPLLTARRGLRTKAGVNTHELLRAAEMDEPVTSTLRPPPCGMDMKYILSKVPDVSLYQRESAVWSAPNFRAAWSRLHKLYAEFLESDPERAKALLETDWNGLALCTSYAETLHLMSLLAPSLREAIVQHPLFDSAQVEEFFVHVGQDVEVRGGGGWVIQLPPPTVEELQFLVKQIGRFGSDGRGCVAHTAHRASGWRGRHGEMLGVTLRVGRYVPGVARALLPLAQTGSLLIISKAGMGKTTLLRDLASGLAQNRGMPRVTVVDTSNEIGGDGPIPLPYLGRCRRIQVPTREDQSRVMTEVIQNHTPECLIVDEIATEADAEAAWSIAQRGVRLIGTCHGETLEGLLQNRALNLLVGGAAQAFLSNEERRLRNKTKKTVLERPFSAPFQFVVELHLRNKAHLYVDVNKAVDLVLDDQSARGNASVGGSVDLREPLPPHIERLLELQGKQKRQLERGLERDGLDAGDAYSVGDAFEELPSQAVNIDSDGYAIASERRGRDTSREDASAGVLSYGTRSSSGHSRKSVRHRQRKSVDEELYKEIRGFF
ncbi:putative YCF45 [Leptomonas seymouri]|uniref:Putative YCF45 n=1 Tax=Leptomonas seymouri TaxID=5684 RepID=A0A0N0P8P0_LEPSE|nr:putative YCF45 [Leptomonas seymouri]|eukprot:KPI90169.1 putative YCF45 [Leptomonas seymouri]